MVPNQPVDDKIKKGSSSKLVILDLSWPHSPEASVNGGHPPPRDSYLGPPNKMHLPSASDITDNICKVGRGAWLYSAHIAWAYHQLPLDPLGSTLICFLEVGEQYFTDVSLSFGMRWATSAFQDTTSM